jgi:hypothetical protein
LKRGSQKSTAAFGKRLDVPGGQRKSGRSPVRLSASLQALNCSRPVTLLDVSKTGAKMAMPESMYRGQEVWLKVADTQIFGTVRWVRGQNCGIAFDAPLTDRQLTQFQNSGRTMKVAGVSRDDQLGADDWQAYAAFTGA